MKFSEFKKTMKRHNELCLSFKDFYITRQWSRENLAADHAIEDFLKQNPNVFIVNKKLLQNKLKDFLQGVDDSYLINISDGSIKGKYPIVVGFYVFEIDSDYYFTMDVAEWNEKHKGTMHNNYFNIARIVDGEKSFMSCVNLADILDYSNTKNCRRKALFSIPGFEEALWQVVEESFNENVAKQISMLERINARVALRKAELQQPDYVDKEIAKLDEEGKQTDARIEALKAQLG